MYPAKSENGIKTTYQWSYDYKELPKSQPVETAKPRNRPDLYFYDSIVNEKQSTYRKYHNEKKFTGKACETYRKFDLCSKYTLKNLYDEFSRRPVRELKNNATVTGSSYIDPTNSVEEVLLRDFCTESSSNEINRSFSEHKFCESFPSYETTSRSEYRDFVESMVNGIAKHDTITYWNGKHRNKYPSNYKIYRVTPKVFFRIPFGGETSIYNGSYKNPDKRSDFLSEMCVYPDYFQSIKNEASVVPGMYSTDQKVTGSGKRVQAVV